jgi:cysteine desulfurase/selenocysteine lyase
METNYDMMLEKLNIVEVRKDFPILEQKVYGKKLVYFDNGATTQKPIQVLEALDKYYREYNSNVHRGVHFLSQKATDAHEHARKNVAAYINAKYDHEIIFTRGTTESINLVASSFGKKFLHAGDSILISAMEHHSNIVPWQMVCEEKGAKLKVIPMDENGVLLIDKLPELLDGTVKLVACNYISNSLGTINPIQEIIKQAHGKNIPVLIDAAQAVQHIPVDVQALDADFLVFSGHKLYGPTGIGVLYGKEEWLNKLPPYQGGGEMIKTVTFEKTTFNDLPFKFEAGTPDISGTIGLSAAIDYINNLGLENIHAAETELLEYALEKLTEIEGLTLVGNSPDRAAVIAFSIKNLHPFDIGELLDKQGIAVRTGHHCTQPIMDFFCIPGTVRVSLAFYNTFEEVDILVAGLKKAIVMLS